MRFECAYRLCDRSFWNYNFQEYIGENLIREDTRFSPTSRLYQVCNRHARADFNGWFCRTRPNYYFRKNRSGKARCITDLWTSVHDENRDFARNGQKCDFFSRNAKMHGWSMERNFWLRKAFSKRLDTLESWRYWLSWEKKFWSENLNPVLFLELIHTSSNRVQLMLF